MPSKSGIIGQLTNQILRFIELFLQMILGTRKMKESYSENGLSVCTYDSERRLRVKKNAYDFISSFLFKQKNKHGQGQRYMQKQIK